MDLNNLKAASTITVNLIHFNTFEPLDGFSVTCYAPTSVKYKSEAIKVEKKHANKDAKPVMDMIDVEIDCAVGVQEVKNIDIVTAVTTGCELVFDGERLTLEQFKDLVKKKEYYWIVLQVKAALDSGKLEVKKSETS